MKKRKRSQKENIDEILSVVGLYLDLAKLVIQYWKPTFTQVEKDETDAKFQLHEFPSYSYVDPLIPYKKEFHLLTGNSDIEMASVTIEHDSEYCFMDASIFDLRAYSVSANAIKMGGKKLDCVCRGRVHIEDEGWDHCHVISDEYVFVFADNSFRRVGVVDAVDPEDHQNWKLKIISFLEFNSHNTYYLVGILGSEELLVLVDKTETNTKQNQNLLEEEIEGILEIENLLLVS